MLSAAQRRWSRLAPALLVCVAVWLMVRESVSPSRAVSSPRDQASAAGVGGLRGERQSAPALATASADDELAVGTVFPTSVTTMWWATWGGGPTDLGRAPANESSPEGPMSFVVDANGRSYVLDQVNERVQVFEDGEVARSIPLPGRTYQDLAVREDGTVAVLDRLGDSAIAFVDSTGQVRDMVSLAGPAIPDGGSVTAMFQRQDGTWVEVEHQYLVRVADAAGNADSEQPVAQGRFRTAGGGVLRAARVGPARVAVTLQMPGAAPEVFAYTDFPLAIAYLTALETDARGRVYVGANLYEESPEPPFEVTAHAEVLVVFDPAGVEIGRLELDSYDGPEERFCTIRVAPDGVIYHLVYGDDGVALRRYEI